MKNCAFPARYSLVNRTILWYTPVHVAEGWTLFGFIPMEGLKVETENRLLIGFVSASLLILFVFDMAVMLYFNKKLHAAAREAATANKAKTDFLSAVSHDIRTPTNAIIGLTAIAERKLCGGCSLCENGLAGACFLPITQISGVAKAL